MTRKDFVLIAEAMKTAKPNHHKHDDFEKEAIQAWSTTVTILTNRLQETNPLFDRSRFMEACGVEA